MKYLTPLAGLAVLFSATAATGQSSQVTKMAECKLPVADAKVALGLLKKIKDTDLSNLDADEMETTYDAAPVRAFGFKAKGFYYATYEDDYGSDQMFQTNVTAKYDTVKSAVLRSFGQAKCAGEDSKDGKRACSLKTISTTQVTPIIVEGTGVVSILCSYPW